jgi:nucleoside 2-deoxyribosyltransferase
MNVYIASPLFSETERLFNDSICSLIEKSYNVHLPQRDGPLVERLIANGMSSEGVRRLAYESDIDAIKKCDVLIAVLDGRALDEGVCIEMGFAKALGKHIVGFKSDVRIALPWGNNPMVDGCVDMWVHNIAELSAYIANPNI